MNILFISFEYPPLNRGGVYRPRSFAKYLPGFGISPVVVTLAPESYDEVFGSCHRDNSLVPGSDEKIIYVKSSGRAAKNRLSRFISIYFSIHGNETLKWRRNFLVAANKAIKEYDIQAIFATVPPFGVLPLALKLARSHNLPLIYDFRDAWSQWRTIPFGSRLHYWLNLYFERKYLRRADAILVTSTVTLNDLKRNHPSIEAGKFHYIPNGYEGNLADWNPRLSNEIVIGYVGSFYYSPEAREQMLRPWYKKRGHRILQYTPFRQDWLYRSPYFFFKSLQKLVKDFPHFADRIKVRFAGKHPDWIAGMVSDFDLDGIVELKGEVPYADAIQFQESCDLLLITSAKRLGAPDYSIAGKTFEYFQVQKPILAFVCEGAQKDILVEAGTALICDPDNIEASVRKIVELIEGRIVLTPDSAFIQSLSRKHQVSQLANIIRQVVKGKS